MTQKVSSFAAAVSTFGSGTDHISLLIIFVLFLLRRERSLKSLRLHRFKSDQDKIRHDCSSSKSHRLTESDFFYSLWA